MVTMDAEKSEAERECFYLPSNLLEDSDSIHVEEDDFADLAGECFYLPSHLLEDSVSIHVEEDDFADLLMTGVKPITWDDITFNNTYVIQEESR